MQASSDEHKTLSEEVIRQGLSMLDNLIGTSELLMSVAPIRIMVAGGVVAVTHLHTRLATQDFDFILDTNIDAAEDYREEFFQAIKTVSALVKNLPLGTMNDHMRVFIRPDKRKELFLLAVQQNVVIYNGENLVAYASPHEWALETKLARIETLIENNDGRKRDTDIADAVELVRLIIQATANGDSDNGNPITAQYMRTLNFNGHAVQAVDRAIAAVGEAFKVKYGKNGIV